jgi:hypothetical protein
MESQKFLRKIFNKLVDSDFEEDRFLLAFHRAYKKEREKEKDKQGNYLDKGEIELFSFFVEYLIRNKNIDEKSRAAELQKLYDEISYAIINPEVAKEEEENPRFQETNIKKDPNGVPVEKKRIKKIIRKKIITDKKTGEKREVITEERIELPPAVVEPPKPTGPPKINKEHTLTVLSRFIERSFIVVIENPDEVVTETDELFKQTSTDVIMEETLEEYKGRLPPVKKDPIFNRKLEMNNLWLITEKKCQVFIDMDKGKALEKVYIFDAEDTLNAKDDPLSIFKSNAIRTLEIRTDDKKDIIVPEELIKSRRQESKHNTIVRVANTNPINEALDFAEKKRKCIMLMSGSRWVPGGNSDQGIECNETKLYYSSTYHIPLNRVTNAYPLKDSSVIVIPNVLVFKDPSQPTYPTLAVQRSASIAVINSAPPLRPDTNIDCISKSEMDPRLYSSKAKYRNPEKTLNQFRYIFETALFFGHDTIIIDDRGIEYFWLPVEHTIKILNVVINRYKTYFREIVIAIERPNLYDLFKQFIS